MIELPTTALDGRLIAALGFGAGALAVTAAHFFAEPMRWRLSYLPNEAAPASTIRDVFLCASLASYILPFKLGVPLRVLLVRHFAGVKLADIGVLIAADSILTLSVWGAFTMAGWGVGRGAMAAYWPSSWTLPAMLGLVLAVLVAASFSRIRSSGFSFLVLLKRDPMRLVLAILIMTFDVMGYGLRHALFAAAVGVDPSLLFGCAVAGVVATFAGMLSGMPMGLLGYDAALLVLFTLQGVGPGETAVVIILNRAMSILCAVALGMPAASRLGLGRGVLEITRKLRSMASGSR